MIKRCIFILVLTAFALAASRGYCDVELRGVYIIGAFNCVPYQSDSGLNYSIDYFNSHQPGLTSPLAYPSSMLGYTAGVGFCSLSKHFLIAGDFDWSGLYAPALQASANGSNYTLNDEHGIISLDLSFQDNEGFFSIGAGAGLDVDIHGQKWRTTSETKLESFSMLGGKIFLIAFLLPIPNVPLAIYLKPYYAFMLPESYDGLFDDMNGIVYYNHDNVRADLNHFGFQAGIYWFLTHHED